MKCPFCSHMEDKVIDSRPTEEGSAIRRRRECLKCGARFTTYEKIEDTPLIVIKKDGTRQIYDRNKIINCILKACSKRPVSITQVEDLAINVEQVILNSMKREITSTEIGELIMPRLKNLDEVAYVRFASVYKQFKDVDTFMAELSKIIQEK
ncbi:MAG: transcriptional repressor NrdR [Ruminococcaceae bacterium]|nr:transcriptional repressor NrdR [Oscillospiraceae bacterium]